MGRENWQFYSFMMPYTLVNTGRVKGRVGVQVGTAELKVGGGDSAIPFVLMFCSLSDAKPNIRPTQRVFVAP